MRNKKYDYKRNIRQYVFDEKSYNGYIPVPDGDLIERAAYALYTECLAAEYASVDLAEDGSVLVSNFKEDYEVHLNPADNGGVKVIAKINRFYGKSQVQRTFKKEDDATADAIRYLVWLAASKFAARSNNSITRINRRSGVPSVIPHREMPLRLSGTPSPMRTTCSLSLLTAHPNLLTSLDTGSRAPF